MKYLLITTIMHSQTYFCEVTQDYIYKYGPKDEMPNSQLIDRKRNRKYIIQKGRIENSLFCPNEKNWGWSSGDENVVGDYKKNITGLGTCNTFDIKIRTRKINSQPFLNDDHESYLSKSYVSFKNTLIQKYFLVNNKLEFRILLCNRYGHSNRFPFHVESVHKMANGKDNSIMKVHFEEREVDENYKAGIIWNMISSKLD